jgi:hypothetical protein
VLADRGFCNEESDSLAACSPIFHTYTIMEESIIRRNNCRAENAAAMRLQRHLKITRPDGFQSKSATREPLSPPLASGLALAPGGFRCALP